MRILLAIVPILFLASCAAWTTPSTYSNYSTPSGNAVQAQGRAAQYAASANTSANCPSCTGGTSNPYSTTAVHGNHTTMGTQPAPQDEFVEQVTRDFFNNLRWAISRKTTEIIYDW